MFDMMKSDKCVKFILETTSAFENIKDVDHDASLHELHHENDHILESLDHLLHLTTKPELSLKIAETDGLEIMSDIYKTFIDNDDIRMIVTKIVTNMTSARTEIIDYFFKSGWIYLLSKWQHDDDLRIQVLASTALNNLDQYETSGFVYQPKLYPLYPRRKVNEKPALDLIFVHGILGGIWVTWRVQRESDMLEITKENKSPFDDKLRNLVTEEAVFRDEKIVQIEPGPTSKLLTITEQTTKNVFSALNEMAEEKLSIEDVSLFLIHFMVKIF